MIGRLFRHLRQMPHVSVPQIGLGMIGRLGAFGVIAVGAGIWLLSIHPEPVVQRSGVAIIHPWARGDARINQALPVYLVLTNSTDRDDTLIGIDSPIASQALIKRLSERNGLVQATELQTLFVPQQGRVAFRPGELQITLSGLDRAVAPGDDVPINLRFVRAGLLSTKVRVENHGTPEHADHF